MLCHVSVSTNQLNITHGDWLLSKYYFLRCFIAICLLLTLKDADKIHEINRYHY